MQKMVIYAKNRRITVYAEGGCHVDEKQKDIGWVHTDDWTDADTLAIDAARNILDAMNEKMAVV